ISTCRSRDRHARPCSAGRRGDAARATAQRLRPSGCRGRSFLRRRGPHDRTLDLRDFGAGLHRRIVAEEAEVLAEELERLRLVVALHLANTLFLDLDAGERRGGVVVELVYRLQIPMLVVELSDVAEGDAAELADHVGRCDVGLLGDALGSPVYLLAHVRLGVQVPAPIRVVPGATRCRRRIPVLQVLVDEPLLLWGEGLLGHQCPLLVSACHSDMIAAPITPPIDVSTNIAPPRKPRHPESFSLISPTSVRICSSAASCLSSRLAMSVCTRSLSCCFASSFAMRSASVGTMCRRLDRFPPVAGVPSPVHGPVPPSVTGSCRGAVGPSLPAALRSYRTSKCGPSMKTRRCPIARRL